MPYRKSTIFLLFCLSAAFAQDAVSPPAPPSRERPDHIEAFHAEAVPFEKALSGISGTAAEERNNTAYYRIDGVKGGPGHYELIVAQNEIIRVSGADKAPPAFQEERGLLIPCSGNRLWIKVTFKTPGKYRFALNPAELADIRDIAEKNKPKFETSDKYRASKNQIKSTEREEFHVTMRGDKERVFVIDTPAQNFSLVTFSMDAGQPVAGLSAPSKSADFARGKMFVFGGQYWDDNESMTAVVPEDTGRIIGWNALPSSGDDGGVRGSFSMRNYELVSADTLGTGRTVWRPKALLAKEYHIESNRNRTAVIKLSPRTGILHILADGKRKMYYGGETGARYAAELNGGRLFLFGKSDNGNVPDAKAKPNTIGKIELEMYASSSYNNVGADGNRPDGNRPAALWQSQTNGLNTGAEIIKHFQVNTREIIAVTSDTSTHRKLFLSGSVGRVDWIGRSGRAVADVKTGDDLPNENGVMFVNYPPGVGKLKLCRDDGSALALNQCLWGETVKTDDAPVIKETSRLTMADGANWYVFEPSEPTHISLSAPVPAAAIVSVDGKVRDYMEFWDGLSWDIPLAPGKFAIGIKQLAGKYPSSAPVTIGIYPIPTLAENKPLDKHLFPGQKRFARFNVEQKSQIGIGLAITGADAEAVLFDSKGNEICKGRQIFIELDKGAYYLQLSPLSTDIGSEVKLYLFGQTPPPRDPPEELIKWIIRGGVGERPRILSPPK